MDFKKAVTMVRRAGKVLITTHTRPDGDALGCVTALAEMVREDARRSGREVEAQALILSEPAGIYDFLLDGCEWLLGRDVSEQEIETGRLDMFDLIILVDTSATRQLPGVGDYLREKAKNLLVIDHHLSGDITGQLRLVDTKAAAAGEIVYALAAEGGLPITRKAAQSLFTAIATDTGWFRFESTRAVTLTTAAALVEAGVDPAELYRQLYESDPEEKLRLTAAALDTLQLHHDGRLATLQITQEAFRQTGTDRTHVENIVNMPLQIGSVRAVVLFVEVEEQITRCSFRSKDTVDVNRIAGKFDGGGHAHAAGATLHCSLADACKQVLVAFNGLFE